MRLSPLYHLLPLLALAVVVFTMDPADEAGGPAPVATADPGGRLVVVIVDSLRRATLEEPGVMPATLALRGAVLDQHTCSANFTLPCVQTMFEGRESPFSAGLHNFTGKQGGSASLPGAAHAAGLGYAVISDQTLTSLYGREAIHSINVDTWPAEHLERDIRAIDEGIAMLAEPEVRVLLLHVPGTDKVSHYQKPGSEEYRAHFAAVDARIGALARQLDPARDSLVVLGDHGHDKDGHHTRDSVVVLWGERLATLLGAMEEPLTTLDQTDLLYVLAFPLRLPMPADYEGRYLPVRDDAPEAVRRFVEVQREALAAAGFDAPTLEQGAALARERADAQRLGSLLMVLPLLVVYVAWLLWFAPGPGAWPGLVSLGFGTVGIGLGLVTSPALGPWLAVPAAAGAAWAARRAGVRRALFLLMALGLTAAIAYGAKSWAEFFHTRGGFIYQIPAFYLTILGAGAALAATRDGSLQRLGTGALAFAILCLPSGVYYYQTGQNMLQPFVLGAFLVFLVQLTRKGRAALPSDRGGMAAALLLAASVPLLFLQEAGGWEYGFFAVPWLRALGPVPTLLLYYGFGLWLTLESRGAAVRVALLAALLGGHLFSVVVGRLPLEVLVAAFVPVVFVVAWLRVRALGAGPESVETEGLVLLGGLLFVFWLLFQGFFINKIDFTFGFDWFSGLQRERDVFALIWLVSAVKYGLPIGALLLAVRAVRTATTSEAVIERSFWWLNVKLLALLVAIQVGALGTVEKLYELSISDLVFISNLAVIAGTSYLVVWAADRVSGGSAQMPAPPAMVDGSA